jgi:two-component system sensor kinase FixL
MRTRAEVAAKGGQALHDLQIADVRWQAILGTIRDAIIAIDRRGSITLFNPAAEQVFGYRAEEVLGHKVSLLMPEPYRSEHDAYMQRYHETGERRAIGRIRLVEGRRKNGDTFPLELSVSESRLGSEVLYTAILRDTSPRIATEQALRYERDFAERLIDTAQVIVLVVDAEGRVVRHNAFMERLSGRRLDEVVGADWLTTFIAARDQARLRACCTAASRTGDLRGNIGNLVSHDGRERQIEWSMKTVLDAAGEVSGLLCIGVDITERLAAEAELRELQRVAHERGRLADIGAITAKVVHDLGNPLAALSMQAQLILRRARRGDFQPAAPVQQPAEQILQTLRRLEDLVHEFTDFARDQRLKVQDIHLERFLASCVELWQALATDHGIALALSNQAGVRSVRADEVMLRRVLDNLIKNAIEAIGAGPGEVIIETRVSPSGRIGILVSDTGPGVPDGVDVFTLFETTKAEGTGIGLAVAKQIIAAHGGVIDHSPHSPRGTTFRIELPIDGPTKHTPAGANT